MDRISRYIMRQLVLGMIVTTVVLSGMFWLTRSVQLVELLINRGLSASTFMYLTMLSVPNLLYFALPIAAFVVIAFFYSKLNSDRELVVLRAAGVSNLNIAKPALLIGLILTGISYSFAMYFTPTSHQKFRDLQWNIRYSFSHVLLKEGVFNTVSDELTIYIRERNGEADLRGVLVHDDRDPNNPVTYIAERGVLVEGNLGPRVIVFDGSRQQLDRKTGKLSILYFDRTPIELDGIVNKPSARYREPRERTLAELLVLKKEDLGNPNDYGKFVVEIHQRFTGPMMVLSFVLVTIAFSLVGSFSRQGQGKRMVAATLVNILIAVANLGFANLAAKSLDLVPTLYATALLPTTVCLILLVYHPRFRNPFARPASGVA